MRKTTLTLAAAMAAAALALAGCSSSGSSSGSASKSAGSGSSLPSYDVSGIAKDATIAALLPSKVASAGTLVVASDTSYAPAEFLADDNKTAVGYDVDLIKAIGQVLGVKVDVQTANFDSIIPAVGSKYDASISSFTIRADREQQVNMIEYYSAGEAYAVAKGNPKKVAASTICGLTVGVQTGTVEDDELATYSGQCVKDGKKAVDVLKYDHQSDVTTNLVGGKVDVMYADSPIVAYAVKQTGGQIEQLGDVFSTAPQGIVVAKSDTQLTDAIQKALQKLIDDGTYLAILKAWGNESGAVTTAQLNPAVS